MVWGMISVKGPSRLHVCEGMMNAAKYIDVLSSRAIPQLKEWCPNGGDFVFMHDGAPCHSAMVVKRYLEASHVPVL